MTKSFTSRQIADVVGGKLIGSEDIVIEFLGPPNIASENMLGIAFEQNHIENAMNSKAQCFLVPVGVELPDKTLIQVERPKLAMGKLLYLFYDAPESTNGIHPSAVIAETATIGKNVSIGPNCVVGSNTIIGDNTKLLNNVSVGKSVKIDEDCLFYPNAVIGDRVSIGNGVILHNGVSIGADGFSYITEKASNLEVARQSGKVGAAEEQVIVKVPSIGSVEIHDFVEIGANSCIDRGTLENTIIGAHTKIDNLVMIGHNAIIGQGCFIVAQVGISGSSKIGHRCILAGQVGVVDHVEIGDDTIVSAKSGVLRNLPGKAVYMGNPAIPRREFVVNKKNVKSISDLKKRIENLEKSVKVEELVK